MSAILVEIEISVTNMYPLLLLPPSEIMTECIILDLVRVNILKDLAI